MSPPLNVVHFILTADRINNIHNSKHTGLHNGLNYGDKVDNSNDNVVNDYVTG